MDLVKWETWMDGKRKGENRKRGGNGFRWRGIIRKLMSSCTVIDAWELKGYNAIIAIANWIRATSRLGPSPISILFFSAFSSTFFCVSVKTGVYLPPPQKNDEHYDVVPIVLFPVLLLTIRLCKFSLKESLFFFSYQDGTLPVSAGRIFYRIGTLPANSLHNCTGCVCAQSPIKCEKK